MSAAKFIKQLQEGNTTEAIHTINTLLRERSTKRIQEARVEVLESYGFSLNEKDYSMDEMKQKMDEMEDEYDSMKNGDEPDEEAMEEMKRKMGEMKKKYESMKKKDM
jgi:archaellum component FlaC